MDETQGVTNDPAARPDRDAVELPPLEGRSADVAATIPPAPVEAETGSLAEVESLQGALYTVDAGGEADVLRRSLDLADRPESMTPTNTEQVREAEMLRREVAAPVPASRTSSEGAADPTDQYEIHEAAVNGNAIARAIEAAGAEDRVLERQLSEDTARVAADGNELALDGHGRAQAEAERAAAAHAVMGDAVSAAGVASGRQHAAQLEENGSAEAVRERSAAARKRDVTHVSDARTRVEETRARRSVDDRSGTQARDEKVVRDRTSMLPEDRTTQMSGSAAAAHFGAGRPPAQVDDRGDDDGDGDHVDRISPVVGVDAPILRATRGDTGS